MVGGILTEKRNFVGNPMRNYLTNMLLWAIILMAISACNPTQDDVTSAPTLETYPNDTPTPISLGTATFTASPVSTVTPAPAVPCFVTYYDPFAFLPDSLRLLVRADMGVQQFNLQTMKTEKFIQAPSIIDGPAVALSPDGNTMAWAFQSGEIQEVRMSGDEQTYTIQSGQQSPLKLEFSPTRDRLYSSSHDGTVQFWDLQGGQKDMYGNYGELTNIGVSLDGSLIAVVPADGPVTLVNADNFVLVRELSGSGGYDTSDVAFSPDGQYLAADLGTGLYIWRISDGAELLGADNPIFSMAVTYSPDGKYLAYSDINNIVLSSPDGSQKIHTLEGHQLPVFELLFSPDSSTLVSADDMEMRVWRVEDGELLAIGKSSCP
jgi:WD40 repeat protein